MLLFQSFLGITYSPPACAAKPLGFLKKVLDVQFVVTYLLLNLLLQSCLF